MTTTAAPEPPAAGSDAATPAFYVTGGTLGAGAASYVERRADRDLLGGLTAGEFCYVLNSRQMGKSSLCVRTMGRLKQQGRRTCFLDLTKFGGRNLSAEQWYAALLSEAGRELGLRSEMLAFWKANTDLGPMQRFFGALQQVALPADASPLTVFVDEIDVTRGLPFSADEFFAGVRQCCVGRATDPALNRLTVCLLGTATPADLIQDTRVSPFNIGRRIEVRDFTPEEAQPLAAGLGTHGPALLSRVLYWTGGHPYLTQRLCRAAQESHAATPADVDKLCSDLFLTRTAAEADDNLAFVRNRLLKSEVDLAGLLDLYGQMRRGRRVPDDEADPLCAVLKLSGVARTEGGALHVRNRIYEHVFSREWIVEHTPGAELRRQREAYRRGLMRAVALSGIVIVLMTVLVAWALQNALRANTETLKSQREADARAAAQRQAERNADRSALLAQQRLAALAEAKQQGQRAQESGDRATLQALRAATKAREADLQQKSAVKNLADAQAQARRADAETRKASTGAVRLRQALGVIRDEKADAMRSAEAAEANAGTANRLAYDADMQVAAQEWDNDDGSAQTVQTLLAAHAPPPGGGGPDLRNFAWYYQRGLLDQSRVNPAGTDVTASSAAIDGAGGTVYVVRQTAPAGRDGRLRIRRADAGGHSQDLIDLSARVPHAVSAEVAPGGDRVAVTAADGSLSTLPATGGPLTMMQGRDGVPDRYGFLPDGRRLYALSHGSRPDDPMTFHLWDAVTGREIRRRVFPERGWFDASLHGSPLLVSPDGSTIALTGLENRSGPSLIGTDGSPGVAAPVRLGNTSNSLESFAFSPDGRTLATADRGGLVLFWDVATHQRSLRLVASPVRITGMAFSPDGGTLATGDANGQIRLWDARSGERLGLLKGHTMPVTRIAFDGAGTALVSTDAGGGVRRWDIAGSAGTSEEGTLTQGTAPYLSLAYTPDGGRLATLAGRTVRLVDARTGTLRWSRPADRALAVSGRLTAVGEEDGSLHLYDTGTGQPRPAPPPPPAMLGRRLNALIFSPGGGLLAGSFGQTVQVWDAASGRPLEALRQARSITTAVAFSPDGRLLAVAGDDGALCLYDTRTWRQVRVLLKGDPAQRGVGNKALYAVAFSPGGRWLAAGGDDDLVHLWDSRTWAERAPLRGHSDRIDALAFSPDGTLASAGFDRNVRLWDADGGQPLRTMRSRGWLYALAFSPDGRDLAVGGDAGVVHVWHAAVPPHPERRE